jgi:hypothetical protein
VKLVPRPVVTEQRAWVLLPSYIGLRPNGTPYEQPQPRGDIVALHQSSARVEVVTQKPIVKAVLELVGPPRKAPRRLDMILGPGEKVAARAFALRPDETAYRVHVWDQYGFINVPPPERGIRLVAEEPPHVALLRDQFPPQSESGGGLTEDFAVDGMPVPFGGPFRIAYVCSGQYGLGRAQLKYRINEEEKWWTLPLKEIVEFKAGPYVGTGTVGTATNAAAGPLLAGATLLASDLLLKDSGPFDPRTGAFVNSGWLDQAEFHAVPSPDPMRFLGRTQGGGRFDFQTAKLPGLKVGDRIEYYVEVFADRNPDKDRPSARSETRSKTVVTPEEFARWIDETLQEERRVRQLESRQRGVFGTN